MFNDVTQHRGAFTRFVIGSEQENPTTFTVRDWHPTKGRVIWKPSQLGEKRLHINGFWALDVAQPGRYQIRLSRFPDDNAQPMNVHSAKIEIGSHTSTQSCAPEDSSSTFEVRLEKGHCRLQTWLTNQTSGWQRGGYFVKIRYLSK